MSERKVTGKPEDSFSVGTFIVVFFIVLLALVVGFRGLPNDYAVVLKWWFTMLLIGVSFFPLAWVMMSKFHDGGYIAAKPLGIAMSGWLLWTLSSFKILKFSQINGWGILLVCAVLNYGLYWYDCRGKGKRMFDGLSRKKISAMICFEALFLLLFTLWCYMRSFGSQINNSTEKLMDFGFMASIMNETYMPPSDMWWSGEPINYYYFGIYTGAFISKLIGEDAGYAYNLDLMMIAALSCVEVYSLLFELVNFGRDEFNRRIVAKEGARSERLISDEKCGFLAHLGGILGAGTVCIAGNMQFVLYKFIIIPFQKLVGMGYKDYYWPNATRFVSDSNEGINFFVPEVDHPSTLIHEFPSYSFMLGDLHAHVTDIIYVLLVVMVLFAFLVERKERSDSARLRREFIAFPKGENEPWYRLSKKELLFHVNEVMNPAVLVASFMLGIIKITNSWDFPIYFVVAGAILLFSNAVITGFSLVSIRLTACHAAIALVLSTVVGLPFTSIFDSPFAGVGIADMSHKSDPWELAVLWALPLSVCIYLFSAVLKRYLNDFSIFKKKATGKGKVVKENPYEKRFILSKKDRSVKHIFSFIYSLEMTDLFAVTAAFCAAGLVLMCELVYVKDIYGSDVFRTNTMFKLGYQAYILFGIVMTYTLVRFVGFSETAKQKKFGYAALLFVLWTWDYFFYSVPKALPEIKNDEYVNSLDSYAIFDVAYKGSRYDEMQPAIEFVKENIDKDAVVAQMFSTSYMDFSLISAYTGNPTPVGWAFHEGLWRNGGDLDRWYDLSTERRTDILKLYTTDDPDEARRIIDKYDIEYIYVGLNETVDGNTTDGAPWEQTELWALGKGDLATGYYSLDETATADLLESEERRKAECLANGETFEESPVAAMGKKKYYDGHMYRELDTNYELLRSLGEVVYDRGVCEYSTDEWYYPTGDWYHFDYTYENFIVKVGNK